MLLAVVALALLPGVASAATDEEWLAHYAPMLESRMPTRGGCPTVTYRLHADAEIDRAFPPGSEGAGAMATNETLPAWEGHPCTVWLRDGQVFSSYLAHELLHTAGFSHGPAQEAWIEIMLKKPSGPLNRHDKSARLPRMKKTQQPKVRSLVARDAHMRNSAGAMDRGKRGRNRHDRQTTKRALRAGSED